MKNKDRHISRLLTLERMYDAENDVSNPRVSSTDMTLLHVINDLIKTIEEMEGEIQDLKTQTDEMESYITGERGYEDY